MKYAILFLLALTVPVASAHAVKSPFVKYNGNEVDSAVARNSPFSQKQSKTFRQKLSQKQNAKNTGYNADEERAQPMKKKKGKRGKSSSGHKSFKGKQAESAYRE